MQRPDQRDARTWVVIGLSPKGEDKITEGGLEAVLRRLLRVGDDHGVFVPAVTYTKGDKKVTVHLMEGYVFVESGLGDSAYVSLEGSPYFHKVMSTFEGDHCLRCINVVTDQEVCSLRQKLKGLVVLDILVGSWVLVVEGRYRNLTGKVLGLEGDHAFVNIRLRSLDFIASIPLVFLETLEDDDIPVHPIATASIYNALHPLPAPGVFRDTLISVLGRLMGYDPHGLVPQKQVMDLVLREEGVGVDLPYGWAREGADGLYRRVEEMYVLLQEGVTTQGASPLMWGLTRDGIEMSRSLNCRPSSGGFLKPLLVAMGRLGVYQPGSFVPRDLVVTEVLNSVGVNPDILPRGWERVGRHGVDRRIGWAFRELRVHKEPPLALQGPKRGLWGLTKEGVEEARRLVRGGFCCTLVSRLV